MENGTIQKQKEEHIKQITLEGEETTVLIKAQDPNDPTRTKNTL